MPSIQRRAKEYQQHAFKRPNHVNPLGKKKRKTMKLGFGHALEMK